MSNRDQKFFRCAHCGNIVGLVHDESVLRDASVPLVCCGDDMIAMEANTSDGAREKHVPAVSWSEGILTVQIGSALHPSTEEHHIDWIYVKTEFGGQRKGFIPGDAPCASFCFVDDVPQEVFAYCNLHGLWKLELK